MVGSRVFIGIPIGVRERDIEHFCKGYGRITEIFFKFGYCFVEFEDRRDAEDAIEELHGKRMNGAVVTVQAARKRYGRTGKSDLEIPNQRYGRQEYNGRNRRTNYELAFRTKHRLIVKNLSSNVNWKELKDYMRLGGEVTYCEAHLTHLNEGVIEFASNWDMKNAIKKLDDTKLNGKRIQLVEDRYGEYGSPTPSTSHLNLSSESKSSTDDLIKGKTASKHLRSSSRSNHRSRSSRSRSRLGRQKDDSTSSDQFKRVNPFRSKGRSVSQSG